MIETNDKDQVYIKFGYGDVGFTCAIDDEERKGFFCFEQLDKSYPKGTDLHWDGYRDISNWDFNKQNVIIEVQDIDTIDDIIFYFQCLKESMLNDFKFPEDIGNRVKERHENNKIARSHGVEN